MLSSQKHEKPTAQSSQNRKVVFPSNSDVAETSNPTENPEMQDIVVADRPQTQKRQREESRPSKKKRRKQNQEGAEAII